MFIYDTGIDARFVHPPYLPDDTIVPFLLNSHPVSKFSPALTLRTFRGNLGRKPWLGSETTHGPESDGTCGIEETTIRSAEWNVAAEGYTVRGGRIVLILICSLLLSGCVNHGKRRKGKKKKRADCEVPHIYGSSVPKIASAAPLYLHSDQVSFGSVTGPAKEYPG